MACKADDRVGWDLAAPRRTTTKVRRMRTGSRSPNASTRANPPRPRRLTSGSPGLARSPRTCQGSSANSLVRSTAYGFFGAVGPRTQPSAHGLGGVVVLPGGRGVPGPASVNFAPWPAGQGLRTRSPPPCSSAASKSRVSTASPTSNRSGVSGDLSAIRIYVRHLIAVSVQVLGQVL